ncbi:MAG: Transglycosylase SLT domain protein [Microgenomates group bacterium GW2011_GWC1_37_8]|uniref:Lytic transglycosylase catalytic n=1 Tax=Candidatus Woesebacteria bacterium GW2011_GWB1_38_8 TaxID=1618570 RepID=A0A0G0NHI0_9BACT|nr:MAG: Transglycosylase SLT domain protein [Microgenomates group bacterium GW2011_GWC1_37_8]KKQ85349.1 MAG: Lytic transglycosylase catalytic [Candidatus Woesebacteria bacterium GW2011_GWB1_38_8]
MTNSGNIIIIPYINYMPERLNRRDFLKVSGASIAAALLSEFLAACAEFEAGNNLVWMPPVLDYYHGIIKREADLYGINPSIIPIMFLIESGFYSLADSGVAKGLGQITESTGKIIAERMGLGKYDLFNPETNIMMSTFWLSELLKEHKNIDDAVCAYYTTNYKRCGEYNNWVLPMYDDRNRIKSAAFDNWLGVKKGGDLALAFQEQNSWGVLDISFSDWLYNRNGQNNSPGTMSNSNCRTVTKDTLPHLIHAKDTFDVENDRKDPYSVISGDNSSSVWRERLDDPARAIFCDNFNK